MTATTAGTAHTKQPLDLAAIGFSVDEIAMLEALGRSYSAFSEQFETEREFQRVSFLKWRYEHGDIERGVDGACPTREHRYGE